MSKSTPKEKKKIDVMEAPKEDFFLQTLVNIVNTTPFTIGITLNVGGLLISGELFSGKYYFEESGAQIASSLKDLGLPKPTHEKIKKSIAKFGSVYNKKPKEIESPVYIHLTNAKFITATGKSIPDYQNVIWRGRISEVQGFILGSLGR